MNRLWNKIKTRGSERRSDSQYTNLEGSGSRDVSRSIFRGRQREMPLQEVEKAIAQGMRHNPEIYNLELVRQPAQNHRKVYEIRYKTLRDNVDKVIKGFYNQRGQDLLMKHGVARETYRISYTKTEKSIENKTINETIAELQSISFTIKTGIGPTVDLTYDNPKIIQHIESYERWAHSFLNEMNDLYQKAYGNRSSQAGPSVSSNLPHSQS